MDDDFRSAMSDVAPLTAKTQKKARHQGDQLDALKELPKSVSLKQLERRYAALGISRTPTIDPNPLTLGEVEPLEPRAFVEWKKDGVQHEVFSRLKHARYPIEGSLDLHRLSVKQAREAMFKFFRLAEAKRWRTVLIAHGRGEVSATRARLKSYVTHWLGQMPNVIAYSSADPRHGGTGAVLILLRKSARAKEEARESFGLKSDPDGAD
jgi:DNA-nicking Smr family endonuclease